MSEISNLIYIKGDNILQFLDVVQTANNIYIFTEYCNNSSLEYLMEKNRTTGLPEKQALDILRQVALAFVQIGILNLKDNKEQPLTLIHRDIKPANILFNDNKVKLADFGFSKMVSQKDDKLAPKVQLGTPNYMSPQVLNNQEYGLKTDVWSAGIVFYEILFGRLPWRGTDLKDLYRNILYCELVFPTSKRISDCSKDLLTRMLTVDEGKRIDWDSVIIHPAILSCVE